MLKGMITMRKQFSFTEFEQSSKKKVTRHERLLS